MKYFTYYLYFVTILIFGCQSESPILPANLPAVTICNQIWTKNNLDVSNYRNGDAIPQVTDMNEWANLSTGGWCWYQNDSTNYAQYGKLYNWYAINDPRGLAPVGWHVPSDLEWNKLVTCLDVNADTTCIYCIQSSLAGAKMKESGTTHWLAPNTGATNSSGFNALPGGCRLNYGPFNGAGNQYGFWWSTTAFTTSSFWYRTLSYSNSEITKYDISKTAGLSVRLIKD
jgi:uncharacterized protein (TIGR02145 family)